MPRLDRTAERLGRLTELIRGGGPMLIGMQDNPDPDAIGAAVGLRELAHAVGEIPCSFAHGGTIGRGENRALVQYLKLSLHPFAELDLGHFALKALVDTQPGTGNNSFPEGVVPDVVIDHHPIRQATRRAAFTDIRSRYGAASTILWEYLVKAGVTPDVPVATALLYGIRSDTQDLGREAGRADTEALEALFPLANKRMLGQIQRGRVPGSYYGMLARALHHAMVYGRCIISMLGEVDNPDMMGEVADLLLRHESAEWTCCLGYFDGQARLSLRCIDSSLPASEVARKVLHRLGTGGGHETVAGGQIRLRSDTASYRRRLERRIRDRLLAAIQVQAERGARLVDTADE